MTNEEVQNLALALEQLRGAVELGFERTSGQTALILQRLDQVDDRHAALVKRVEQDKAAAEAAYAKLEARLDTVEREAVTRTQLTDRAKQIIAIVGLIVAMAGAVIAAIQLTRG